MSKSIRPPPITTEPILNPPRLDGAISQNPRNNTLNPFNPLNPPPQSLQSPHPAEPLQPYTTVLLLYYCNTILITLYLLTTILNNPIPAYWGGGKP